jgi:hypothetical protein
MKIKYITNIPRYKYIRAIIDRDAEHTCVAQQHTYKYIDNPEDTELYICEGCTGKYIKDTLRFYPGEEIFYAEAKVGSLIVVI